MQDNDKGEGLTEKEIAMMTTMKSGLTKAVLAIGFLAAVPMAFAHSHPVSMTPEADSAGAAPTAITMHFSSDLEPKFSSITVTTDKGHVMNVAQSVVAADDKKLMTVALPAMPPAVYIVSWVAVAADGHRLTGEYKFTVK